MRDRGHPYLVSLGRIASRSRCPGTGALFDCPSGQTTKRPFFTVTLQRQNGRRGKSTRRQMEKLLTGKVHDNAPGQCKWIDAKQQRATPHLQKQRKGAMIVFVDDCG
jgi:hypothetical protein